jgi:hypothetical protein
VRALDELSQFVLHIYDRCFKRSVFNTLRGVTGPSFAARITGTKQEGHEELDGKDDLVDFW